MDSFLTFSVAVLPGVAVAAWYFYGRNQDEGEENTSRASTTVADQVNDALDQLETRPQSGGRRGSSGRDPFDGQNESRDGTDETNKLSRSRQSAGGRESQRPTSQPPSPTGAGADDASSASLNNLHELLGPAVLSSAAAEHSVLERFPDQLVVGRRCRFVVHAHDLRGLPCTRGGAPVNAVARLLSDDNSSFPKRIQSLSVRYSGEGRYELSFVPAGAGTVELDVRIGEGRGSRPIRGSPFSLKAKSIVPEGDLVDLSNVKVPWPAESAPDSDFELPHKAQQFLVRNAHDGAAGTASSDAQLLHGDGADHGAPRSSTASADGRSSSRASPAAGLSDSAVASPGTTPTESRTSDGSADGLEKLQDSVTASTGESSDDNTPTVVRPSTRFRVGYADAQGLRPSMEDALLVEGRFGNRVDQDLVAVFDGHGGAAASALVAKHFSGILLKELAALSDGDLRDPVLHDENRGGLHGPDGKGDGSGEQRETADDGTGLPQSANAADAESDQVASALVRSFAVAHRAVISDLKCGTTALVAFVRGTTGWVANLGDSRAVLASRDGSVVRLTTDHKATAASEQVAVKDRGGVILRGRVLGMIAITRALGDKDLAPFLSHVPDVHRFSVDEHDLMILACDGVWDVISDQEAVATVRSTRDAHQAAIRLRNAALNRGTRDNVSVLVLAFHQSKL